MDNDFNTAKFPIFDDCSMVVSSNILGVKKPDRYFRWQCLISATYLSFFFRN